MVGTGRAIVYVQPTQASIHVTGRLEAGGVPTLRCWSPGELRRILLEAGPLVGAAVVGEDVPGFPEAIEALGGVPLITRTRDGRYVSRPHADDSFVLRVLEILEG